MAGKDVWWIVRAIRKAASNADETETDIENETGTGTEHEHEDDDEHEHEHDHDHEAIPVEPAGLEVERRQLMQAGTVAGLAGGLAGCGGLWSGDSGAGTASGGGNDSDAGTDSGGSDGSVLTGPEENVAQGGSGASDDSGPSDGSVVAQPGDVGATLDDATYETEWARSPRNRVVLQSGTIYEPSDTWEVGPNTILDFNGALVRPDHSGDVIHLGPRTRLVRPYIDARRTEWSRATMVVLDTAFGSPYSGEAAPDIEDCLFVGPPGTGTGIRLRDSQAEGIGGGLNISGQIQGFHTGIQLLADGGSGAWVNTVDLDVKLTNYRVGIEHNAVAGAATNGHRFDVDSQPNSESEWLWKLGTDSRSNTMVATVWDTKKYTDETFWHLSSDCGYNNTLVDTMQVHGDWQYVDESGRPSNAIVRWNPDSFQYKK